MAKFLFTLILLSSMLLTSCDDEKSAVLSKSKMEKVLYDYHLTQGIVASLPEKDRKELSEHYFNAVYENNGITKEEFDSSMVWYNRHAEELKDIYDNLQKKYTSLNEELKLKAGSNEMSVTFSEGADTTNIWSGAKLFILRNKDLQNKETFTIKADTSFYKNDSFILSANCNIIKEHKDESGCTLYMGISVRYKNDKITSTVRTVYDTGYQQLKVEGRNDSEIKEIGGFFFYIGSANMRNMAVINNISLYRMHKDEPQPTADTDSLSTDSLKPGVAPEDSVTVIEEHGSSESPTRNGRRRIDIKVRPDVLRPNAVGPSRRKPVNRR